ncbi:MAG: periplasmic heavy metal sensor [Steroidobacteraceae bacterium]
MQNLTDTRARPTWSWVALSLSTILNLFLLGVIAGHFLGGGQREVSLTPMARAVERAQAVLGPKDAAAFRAALERDKPRYAQSADQVAAARRALARQIARSPFDPAAANQALAAWRTSWDRFVGDFSGPLIDALAAISPEGRRRLIDARRARLERGRDGSGPISP